MNLPSMNIQLTGREVGSDAMKEEEEEEALDDLNENVDTAYI